MSSVTPSRCHRPRTASLTTQARNSSTWALFALLAFAISWAMYIPLALATLRSGTLFRQLRIWRVGIWWYLIAVLLPAGLWLAGRSLDALSAAATRSNGSPPTRTWLPTLLDS